MDGNTSDLYALYDRIYFLIMMGCNNDRLDNYLSALSYLTEVQQSSPFGKPKELGTLTDDYMRSLHEIGFACIYKHFKSLLMYLDMPEMPVYLTESLPEMHGQMSPEFKDILRRISGYLDKILDWNI